jgi:hypothetical protein
MDAEYATRKRQLLDECQIAPEIFRTRSQGVLMM